MFDKQYYQFSQKTKKNNAKDHFFGRQHQSPDKTRDTTMSNPYGFDQEYFNLVEPSKIDPAKGSNQRPTDVTLNDSNGPAPGQNIHKVKSTAKMGSSDPIVEIAPMQQQSTMMLREDSSATETNDGMSNMAMLDGKNAEKDEGLFKFKKVKGFK